MLRNLLIGVNPKGFVQGIRPKSDEHAFIIAYRVILGNTITQKVGSLENTSQSNNPHSTLPMLLFMIGN